jgi:hypothetical protein
MQSSYQSSILLNCEVEVWPAGRYYESVNPIFLYSKDLWWLLYLYHLLVASLLHCMLCVAIHRTSNMRLWQLLEVVCSHSDVQRTWLKDQFVFASIKAFIVTGAFLRLELARAHCMFALLWDIRHGIPLSQLHWYRQNVINTEQTINHWLLFSYLWECEIKNMSI